jgi:RNA polymerase sigma-70 factor (ECF subfamily)
VTGTDLPGGDAPDSARHDARAQVEEVARSSYGRLVAYLAAGTGDIAGAEDALADAFVAALATWPTRGVPDRPDSWLLTAARRNLVDAARRRDTARRAAPQVARLLEQGGDDRRADGQGSVIPDVRLQLMFACTHPAIDVAVRSPLMLQTVLGLDAARIGALFLVEPTTMGQRLVRAKAKIKRAGVPFRIPGDGELPGRVGAVLDAVYAAYTAGWDELGAGPSGAVDLPVAAGAPAGLTDLAGEAVRLGRLVVRLLPDDPEAAGLLALLLHSHARRDARRAADGTFVPLQRQDTSRWSSALMAEAEQHLARATTAGRLGPYQLLAAIQSVHALRAVTGTTDTHAVAQLYEGLVHLTPTVGVLVARAAAVLADEGATAALRYLDELPMDRVRSYQPYWVTRAAVLDAMAAPGASAAREQAVRLTADAAVRAHLASGG